MSGIHVDGLRDAPPEVYSTYLQAGDYDIAVQSCDLTVARSGSQGIKQDLLIENGPMQTLADGQTQVSPVGRHLFDTAWLPTPSQKDGGNFCRRHLAKIVEVLGVPPSDDLELEEFIGRRAKVRVKVVYEDSEGKDLAEPRNEIVRWTPLD